MKKLICIILLLASLPFVVLAAPGDKTPAPYTTITRFVRYSTAHGNGGASGVSLAHFNTYSANRQAAFLTKGDKNPVFTSLSTCYGNKTISAANGPMQYIRVTGNCTFNSWTQPASGTLKLLLRVTNTGAYTLSYTGVKWPGGSAPTLSSGAGKIDWLACILDGTSVSCVATQDFQ